MDRTADKSTPQIPEATGFPLPWDEALKRAGSFDKLRPYLHTGQILACHGGLYTLSDGKRYSGPGMFAPEKWFVARTDRAGRVIFITEPVVFGYTVIQEEVFAYASSIKLDSVAFDAFFPVADLPPAEQREPHWRAVEVEVDAAAPGQAHPRPLTTPAEPEGSPSATQQTVAESASATSAKLPGALNPGGRPTDRARIVGEARRRLREGEARRRLGEKENVPDRLAPFCRDLRTWLQAQPNPELNSKTNEVMSVDTIEGHVRDMFWEFWRGRESR